MIIIRNSCLANYDRSGASSSLSSESLSRHPSNISSPSWCGKETAERRRCFTRRNALFRLPRNIWLCIQTLSIIPYSGRQAGRLLKIRLITTSFNHQGAHSYMLSSKVNDPRLWSPIQLKINLSASWRISSHSRLDQLNRIDCFIGIKIKRLVPKKGLICIFSHNNT